MMSNWHTAARDYSDQRSKFQSLIGVEVLAFSLDSNPIEPPAKLTIEAISSTGLLFRGEKSHLIFASSAAFQVASLEEGVEVTNPMDYGG